MLSKGGSNKVLAALGKGHDPNATVFSALDPTDQTFLDKAIDGDTDRTRSQIYDWSNRIDWQRPLVQQCLQHAEIRQTKSSILNTGGCVSCQGAHRLHHYQPNVVRLLNVLGHKKNLNLLEVYRIDYIDINVIDAMQWRQIKQENEL
jgi:hypothetical protein